MDKPLGRPAEPKPNGIGEFGIGTAILALRMLNKRRHALLASHPDLRPVFEAAANFVEPRVPLAGVRAASIVRVVADALEDAGAQHLSSELASLADIFAELGPTIWEMTGLGDNR